MNHLCFSARLLAICSLMLSLTAHIAVAKERLSTADLMANAAKKYLATLNADQKKKTSFEYNDSHRTGWYFMPKEDKNGNYSRKGLPLEELNDEQRKAAMELLSTGMSKSGFEQAQAVIGYEALLKQVEKKPLFKRNTGWYFVSIFGTPGNTGNWGWRIEGHHMVASYTIENGVVISPTPFFFGSNPGIVKDGPNKGKVILPGLQDTAVELIKSFNEEQRTAARSELKQFPEIEENVGIVKLITDKGVAAAKLSDTQKALLKKLMDIYIDRMPEEIAAGERKAINEAGFEKVTFAYTGEPLNGYSFQIVGPTFHARMLNTQPDGWGNPNNHIHSVWRRLPGDFGLQN